VKVEVLMDEEEEAWLTYDTYTQDSIIKLDCNGCVVKITPSGGAYATLVRP